MALGGYLFGGSTGLSYDQLQRRREIADQLAKQVMGQQPKNTMEGLGAVLKGAAAGIGRYQTDKDIDAQRTQATSGFNDLVGKLYGGITGGAAMPAGAAGAQPSGSVPAADVSQNGSTFSPFIDTVKGAGLSNPYGLAAVASTGRAESGWSPKSAAGSWSDPSESGQAGTAGGVMSWRGPRLAALQKYAASKGEQGNGSPQTQAEFFVREDPNLIASLNNAKSTDEAQSAINRAWAFAGYNRPGGESARRLSYANGYLPQFQGQTAQAAPQGGTQVASLDPSAGMPSAGAAAIQRQAPGSGYVDPTVRTPNYNPTAQGPQIPASPQPQQQAAAQLVQVAQNTPRPMTTGGTGPSAPSIDPRVLQFIGSPQFQFLDKSQQALIMNGLQVQQQRAQQAQEEQMWRARQDYTSQQQQSDPLRQAQVREANARADVLGNPNRPITADERKQWGIPDTDTRPYSMTAEGPKLIGSTGQTINIGGQAEQRKQLADQMGLKPDDPRYMGYILNGELPKENQQNLTAVDKKAIQEADDMVAANQSALQALTYAEKLSPDANSGWFAGTRASIGNNLPDWAVPDWVSSPASSQATTDMDNAIVGQALSQLKTIFGGNPTEGERAILLQLQGSSSMPAAVRTKVFERARELAEKRLKYNQDRASDLRGGSYYKPGSASATAGQAPAANVEDLLKKYGSQ